MRLIRKDASQIIVLRYLFDCLPITATSVFAQRFDEPKKSSRIFRGPSSGLTGSGSPGDLANATKCNSQYYESVTVNIWIGRLQTQPNQQGRDLVRSFLFDKFAKGLIHIARINLLCSLNEFPEIQR